MTRKRSKPHTFEGRIEEEKGRLEEAAANLSHGPQKELLLEKISQLETAAYMYAWLTSPRLQPPK
jgi:hypothetical protein